MTATRGDGGQNEIGPEIFDALAVLRSEELIAAHRFDGAEEYFTRAVDFGFSFSIDETYEKWGKDEIISDYVRHMIRTIRPDVVVGFLWDGTGGGQHHQASTHITDEAFHAAGDPNRYPEQIKEGLRPWQPKKFYYTGSGAGGGGAAVVARVRWRSRHRGEAASVTGPACEVQERRSMTRFSGGRYATRSASKRGACTSARARRSCSPCRVGAEAAAMSTRGRLSRWRILEAPKKRVVLDGIDVSWVSLEAFCPICVIPGAAALAESIAAIGKATWMPRTRHSRRTARPRFGRRGCRRSA